MARNLTKKFKELNSQINKSPSLVLEIEGSQYLYGSTKILETARWDDPRITWDNESSITWDGAVEKANSKPYIMLKPETTKEISEQLLVDKGGSGSISVMNIQLVDYRGEVAQDLSFNQIGDPLGKKATVYMGFAQGRFPEDYIPIIRGYVDDTQYKPGSISVSVTLASNLIRQSSYEKYQSIITAPIDATQVVIPVETTQPFFESVDSLTSYIRIDDEIMEVVSSDDVANTFTVVRSRLGTIPTSHEIETELSSYYQLKDSPIPLALKLLHSKEGNEFQETKFNIITINAISSTESIQNAIVVNDKNIEERLGLIPGDKVRINSGPNIGIKTIKDFGVTTTNTSYVVVEETLIEELSATYPLLVRSQYNVLPDGAGLDIEFVDTSGFIEVADLFNPSFVDYDFKINDTIDNTRDFIIKEICLPMGLYLIPREAKTSIRFTSPPFSAEPIPVLNTRNVYKLSTLKMRRSTHKYLLNGVVYRYNKGILEDKFFDKNIRISADSLDRIKTGKRRQEIESSGLVRSSENRQAVERISRRILNRYKFGARYIENVKVLLSVGLSIEIGSTVNFGGSDTQMVNIQTGKRDLPIEQYEVISKKLNATQGTVVLTLLETGFGLDGIFATFSPSSLLLPSSTSSKLFIKPLWASDQFILERDKWTKWEGLKIRVRSEDYDRDETRVFTLDNLTDNGLILDTPLSFTPQENDVVELARYEEYGDGELETLLKTSYTFTTHQGEIANVVSTTEIELVDASKFSIGETISVHSEDYTIDTNIVKIDDIVGNTLILEEALDTLPEIGDFVELYTYSDFKGYRFL